MKSIKNKWNTLPKWLKIIILTILGIIGITAMGFIFGLFIMLLWNKLMPEIFGFNEISYWQGIGFFVLIRVLFGSFGGSKSTGSTSKKIVTHNVSLSKSKVSVDPDIDDYETWWQLEGKNAFEQYVETKNN